MLSFAPVWFGGSNSHTVHCFLAFAAADAHPGLSVCRKRTCSKMGRHHLAYGFELESSDLTAFLQVPSMFAYFLLSFWAPLLLGDWQLALAHGVTGMTSSYAFRHDLGEAAAVWCLNSFWMGILTLGVALVPAKRLPFAFLRRGAVRRASPRRSGRDTM